MKRRLALVTLAVTSLIVISFVVPLGILVRRQAEDRALSRAQSDARSIATALAVAASFSGMNIDSATATAVLGAFGFPPDTGIHLPDGTVVGVEVADGSDVAAARRGNAFTARTAQGAAVLIPVVVSGGTSVVRVSVDDADLREGVARSWLILSALALLLVAIALIGVERLGRSIVHPVQDLGEAAAALGSGNLDIRVRPGGPPEIAEVGRTFNDLAERLGGLLQAEREAAADISHSLRTPLAALRLQVESLDSPIRERLLDDVVMVEATVDRVITEARSRGAPAPRSTDLAEATRQRVAFWRVLAADQDRAFEAVVPDAPAVVAATPEDLSRLIDILLENAFSHTASGTAIGVFVEGHTLTVEDAGAGFEPEAIERGTSGGRSTGLGLDIVRRIVARGGGKMSVSRSSRLGGARITIRFGAPGQEHSI